MISYLCDGEVQCRDASDESVYQCFQVHFRRILVEYLYFVFVYKIVIFAGELCSIHSLPRVPHNGCSRPASRFLAGQNKFLMEMVFVFIKTLKMKFTFKFMFTFTLTFTFKFMFNFTFTFTGKSAACPFPLSPSPLSRVTRQELPQERGELSIFYREIFKRNKTMRFLQCGDTAQQNLYC